ncbi:MAG: hypothetical protein NT052_01215 [Candidatus Shapirobacteria bacterium]|nr:hypothetical protein [Candidatus Shapirobacteria bacterium]
MANKCENCPQNCCIDFKIAKELIDPKGLEKELANFSFIKRTLSKIILDPHGYDRLVGIYNCGRFKLEDKTCHNYFIEKRPSFCLNTGITSIPHEQCLLKSNLDDRKKA